ncbi:uncharacterized protein LOC107368735 isoform X3 [Tetranychus urticae]|uniref:Uncharacterized protein n=1 Tax=Tetranychus urticae TaxID=32264 RepID=T1KZN6_TETUR|nr:uncharacterized protein LOC107368735 isoform X3 [Tetranychus urticae]
MKSFITFLQFLTLYAFIHGIDGAPRPDVLIPGSELVKVCEAAQDKLKTNWNVQEIRKFVTDQFNQYFTKKGLFRKEKPELEQEGMINLNIEKFFTVMTGLIGSSSCPHKRKFTDCSSLGIPEQVNILDQSQLDSIVYNLRYIG